MAQVLGMKSLQAFSTHRDRKTGIEMGDRVGMHKDEEKEGN